MIPIHIVVVAMLTRAEVIMTVVKSDYDRAIKDFTKAIELDPDDARAYSGRGYCLSK